MRYLRMFTNALGGGVLGAWYLAVLALQINPQVSLFSMTAVHWVVVFLSLYGFHFTVALFLLILIREGVAGRPLQPAWLSVRLLTFLGAVMAAMAASITWANLKGFRAVLDLDTLERARAGATVLTACAAFLLFLFVLRYVLGRRGGGPTGVLLAMTVAVSVGGPLWLRGLGGPLSPVVRRVGAPFSAQGAPGSQVPAGIEAGCAQCVARALAADIRPQDTARVHLILLDGGSLNFISERVAAGQLPHFGRILDRGALLYLATLRPTQAESVWSAAATGKYPPKNGVRSGRTYRPSRDDLYPLDLLPDYCFASALPYLQLVIEEDATAAALRARTLWDILSDSGIPSGIVRWPLTFPARADRGYVISDRFERGASSPLRSSDNAAAAPSDASEIARDVFDSLQGVPWPEVVPSLVPAGTEPGLLPSLQWDRAYAQVARPLDERYGPLLTAVRYTNADTLGHAFLRYAEPGNFGDVPAADVQRYGAVLDREYAYLDQQIGDTMTALRPGDLLIVMSGFGLDSEGLSKRLLARLLGRPEQSGTHERAPDGFLLAYGTNVAQGQPQRGSIVDLAPTLLYYMGLPVGRDMDGFVRFDLFQRAFTAEHSITYIASYER